MSFMDDTGPLWATAFYGCSVDGDIRELSAPLHLNRARPEGAPGPLTPLRSSIPFGRGSQRRLASEISKLGPPFSKTGERARRRLAPRRLPNAPEGSSS